MGAGDSQLLPFLGMSHLPPPPVPYFHGMLKPSDAQRAVRFQGGPEDPHWLRVHLGRVGRVVSREEELGSLSGKCRKPPARLWNPQQSCTAPSRATNQHGHEPHDPPEKAAFATRWQAEPSIPVQATVPGRKTQSWWKTLVALRHFAPAPPGTSLCPVFPSGEPSMGPHPPIMEQSHWAFRKPWSFSFSTLTQKRNGLAHTHAKTKDSQHLFWEAEGSSTALWCLLPASDFHTTGAQSAVPGTFIPAR